MNAQVRINYATTRDAHAMALRLSRMFQVEVEVHDTTRDRQTGTYRMHQYDERQACATPAPSAANGPADAPSSRDLLQREFGPLVESEQHGDWLDGGGVR